MDHPRWDMHGLAFLQTPLLRLRAGAELDDRLSAKHVQRFVLHLVILAAQRVPRLDVEDLPHVALGAGPDQLVAPGLLDSVGHLGHIRPPRAEARTTRGWWGTPARTPRSRRSLPCGSPDVRPRR